MRVAVTVDDAGLAQLLIASQARADALVRRGVPGRDRFVVPTPRLVSNISAAVFPRFALLMWASPTLKRVPALRAPTPKIGSVCHFCRCHTELG